MPQLKNCTVQFTQMQMSISHFHVLFRYLFTASLPYVAAELGQTVSGTSSGVPHAQRVHGIEYDLSALQSLAQNYPYVGAHGHTHSPSHESAPPAGTLSASVRTTVAHGGQLGASGSLAWQGEIDQLKGYVYCLSVMRCKAMYCDDSFRFVLLTLIALIVPILELCAIWANKLISSWPNRTERSQR